MPTYKPMLKNLATADAMLKKLYFIPMFAIFGPITQSLRNMIMKKFRAWMFIFLLIPAFPSFAQVKDSAVISSIIKEATENSQLEKLAHELMDGIGPRLVGTPQMKQANDWAVAKYNSWGITARNEKWGEWRGWERGISHIDMVSPWVKSLEGTQLAWSPSTGGKTITAEVIILARCSRFSRISKMVAICKRKICNDFHEPANRPARL